MRQLYMLILISVSGAYSEKCISNGKATKCSSITRFERNKPVEIEGKEPIQLYFTNINGELPTETFLGLVNLKELHITSGLTYIEPGAFLDLKSIRTINLYNNKIVYLIKGTFKGCTTLTDLNLSGNHINYIEMNVFDKMLYLQSLNLSGNTKLKVFRDYIFNGLESLKILSCVLCGLHTIEPKGLYGVPNLEQLSLQSNFLGNISGNEFGKLQSLTTLDLSRNGIVYINVYNLLSNVENLKMISLLHNDINCADVRDIEGDFQIRNIVVKIRQKLPNGLEKDTCIDTSELWL